MKTFVSELNYGEEMTVKLNGKYVKGLARAVEGGPIIANAEILLMTDDSDDSFEVSVRYAENGMMTDFIFCNMNTYLHNTELMDVIQFNYVYDGCNKTGVIIVAKAANEEFVNELSKAFK